MPKEAQPTRSNGAVKHQSDTHNEVAWMGALAAVSLPKCFSCDTQFHGPRRGAVKQNPANRLEIACSEAANSTSSRMGVAHILRGVGSRLALLCPPRSSTAALLLSWPARFDALSPGEFSKPVT
eukprot:s2317_g4.t1